MDERGNKTIICSVFFLDIVEYSQRSVSDQISQKERFNAFLSNAIRDVPVNDRIILDTGDGAAISFLGDVEDALRAALRMRKSLQSEEGLMPPALQVRMGVNLGPVRLVKDINGQPNIVGDGINVAQRVMGFASAGQILVSRSYYEAASRLSQEYSGMFQYSGSRTDKHVREHEVYEIGHFGDLSGIQRPVRSGLRAKLSAQSGRVLAKCKGYWNALLAWSNSLAAYLLEKYAQAANWLKAVYVGLAIVLVVSLIVLTVKLGRKPETAHEALPKAATANMVVADNAAQSAVPAVMPNTPAPQVTPKTRQAKPALPAHKPKTVTDKSKTATEKPKSATEKKTHAVPNKEVAAKTGAGLVLLKIKPWGDVYLDGTMIDTCPPLTRLKVPAGEHVIEIRNTTFPVHKQQIKIKAGEQISVSHKFGN